MSFLSGRARFGARSVLRAVFVGAAAILGLFGCGNNIYTYGTPVITFSVTPGPFTAYLAEIDEIILYRSDGTAVYPLLQPQVVDFAKLAEMPEVFGTPALIEGSYVSATISVSYSTTTYQSEALLYTSVQGINRQVTPVDTSGTGAAAASISYTVKFDPNHPLVIKHGVSTPIDFNFDLSAASSFNTTVSPYQVTIRPFMSVSTVPNYTKPMRARGVYVTTDTVNNNNFTMNSRAFFDTQGSPVGAIEIGTSDSTVYNINGTIYQGAAGLAAINKLQINTIVEAYGTFTDLNNIKPTFTATQVFAGVSVENVLTERVTGTVLSRNGNTLHLKGAEVEARDFNIATGVLLTFYDDLTLTIGPDTIVNVDGHPELTNVTTDYISVGQQVDTEVLAATESDGTTVITDANGNPTFTAANGLVRIVPTIGWGVLSASASDSLTSQLLSLGGFQPTTLDFTGTNSDPNAYGISTTGVDTSTLTNATGDLFRFSGLVTPFGMAPPDFVADTATDASANDQVMTVEWVSAGTETPFLSKDANGLVVNISGGNFLQTPVIQSGPLYIYNSHNTIDLTNPVANVTIVPSTTLTPQFTIGNPTSTTGLSVFHDYSSFLTQINSVLTGSNGVVAMKLVAVGNYNATTNVFTAYRIDLLQAP